MRIGQNGGWFSLLPGPHPRQRTGLVWLACALAAMVTAPAQTATETVIHSFANFPHGASPYGTPIRDAAGNLYGTTNQGGRANAGVVFQLDASGHQGVLYSFTGGADGGSPYAGVIRDSAGNLYGTTFRGGIAGTGAAGLGAGVVYKVDPAGHETVLYSFTGGADGSGPNAGVIADAAGNLYGTTYNGGANGLGAVYKLDRSSHQTVLYSFKTFPDGFNPYAGVIADSAGNLYGTTYNGGKFGLGTVYKLDTSGHETLLHIFNTSNGAAPYAGVIRDPAGNLYGTAQGGGYGVVYKVDATGKYTVLYSFSVLNALTMGGNPTAGVVRDAAGNLYGTTQGVEVIGYTSHAPWGGVYKLDTAGQLTRLYKFQGNSNASVYPNPGVILDPAGNLYGTTPFGGMLGMVYQVDTAGQETMLYNFAAAPGGTEPRGGVIGDPAGNLYGTTVNGGAANAGVVYKVDARGHETVLYSFTGGADGAYPQTGVIRDPAGNLYGTTFGGGTASGTAGAGVVYKVDTAGQETVLYTFTGEADGGNPHAGVIRDSAGNLYGTTVAGGAASKTGLQEGVVYKVDPAGHETVLYSFTGLADGGVPEAGVIRDSAGNLYGTASYGGRGCGVVYKLDTAGQETVLYSFTGGADGCSPDGGVIRDSAGNLYGAAAGGVPNGGRVYRLDAAGQYTVLYSFAEAVNGFSPEAGLVRDSAGNLYWTTYSGGTPGGMEKLGWGVVYKLDAAGQETVLHSFTGGADGGQPWAGVILDSTGNLYGTAAVGGIGGGGVVYKIKPQ